MSFAHFLRHARRFSTANSAAGKTLTISQTKTKLRSVYDADEALKVYSSFITTNDSSSSPASARYAQDLTVRRLAKALRFDEITTFLESHKSQPQITQEPFLSSLIRSYGAVGMFENALKTYDEMTQLGTPRSYLSFNALLNACVQSKMFDRVPVYFSEFPAKFDFLPDQYSYGILIKSYCEMGSPELALARLTEMEEKGVEISAVSFGTILHSLYKKGRDDEAEKLWDEMVNKKGCKPDVGCYNARLSHIAEGNPKALKAVIEEMKNAGLEPDTISYNYLITSYWSKRRMNEAKKVYEELVKMKGCRPNSATYRLMVINLCKRSQFITAYKVFKQSAEARRMPDFNTLKCLFKGLMDEKHMNEAKAMVRTVKKSFSPELLKGWDKLEEDLKLADDGGADGVESGENKIEGVDSGETEKASS